MNCGRTKQEVRSANIFSFCLKNYINRKIHNTNENRDLSVSKMYPTKNEYQIFDTMYIFSKKNFEIILISSIYIQTFINQHHFFYGNSYSSNQFFFKFNLLILLMTFFVPFYSLSGVIEHFSHTLF